MIDSTFDLFCELCATDEQCDFPVVYASGVNGIAGGSPADLADDLAPLFEAIVREVSTFSPLVGTVRLGSIPTTLACVAALLVSLACKVRRAKTAKG